MRSPGLPEADGEGGGTRGHATEAGGVDAGRRAICSDMAWDLVPSLGSRSPHLPTPTPATGPV